MNTRTWLDDGNRRLLDAIDALSDEEFAAPCALPDWTRAHLVAHLHLNAEALSRLVSWARTGNRTPMYSGQDQRNADIEEYSRRPPAELRALVRGSAETLARDFDALPADRWEREVETAQGRAVAATEIPWMRTREVAVHAVDLATGITFDDLPGDLLRALTIDVVNRRFSLGEGPALAAWITGRAGPPDLGPWL
ncbi:maleylpyruvate isomerase N-terminal domain-containing protein [Amycolatopsis nigrescens]|uniref:maleylpyruvate isomerase N-terminal domain-containing protein n=1 Tax=Amycolatopsis nigrescens TaxID=381445 RepID=UPI00035D0FCF|nr:maleylpyruvate isomerase N-terminal domain-containing protein [Amycolatopsis nigrescens]